VALVVGPVVGCTVGLLISDVGNGGLTDFEELVDRGNDEDGEAVGNRDDAAVLFRIDPVLGA
jgi:hypothetical protein